MKLKDSKCKIGTLVVLILIIIGVLIGGKCMLFGCIFLKNPELNSGLEIPATGLTEFERKITGVWHQNSTRNVKEFLQGIGMSSFIANMASKMKVSSFFLTI